MKYFIRQLGANVRHELTIDQFQTIDTALTTLLHARNFEQKFQLLLQNYADFENELLRLTTQAMLSTNKGQETFANAIFEVSRRLVNLLTTARLYTDQVKRDLSDRYGKKTWQYTSIESEFSTQFDKLFGYRVLESLRNYVQHEGLPIHSIEFNYQSVDTVSGTMTSYGCTPYIGVNALRESRGFRPQTLADIEEYIVMTNVKDNSLDAKPLVREYLTGLMAVHRKLRHTILVDVSKAEEVFMDTVRSYRDQDGLLVPNVALVEEADGGRERIIRFFIPEVLTSRQKMETTFGNLRTTFVSSAVIKDMRR